MKILIIIDQMNCGGGARVTSTLCRGLVENGYELEMLTDNVSYPVAFPVPRKMKIISFYYKKRGSGILSTLHFNYQIIRKYREAIRKSRPDLIISVMATSFFYSKLATIGMRIPIIASDHTSFSRKVRPLVDFIRFHFYRYADVLTVLTYKDACLLGRKFSNKMVVYNPLSFQPLDVNMDTERRQNILCVGRFDVWKVKGFDIIINIWNKIADKYPLWTLEIAGTGSIESVNQIKSLIYRKGLQDRVRLLGQVDDMAALLRHTSIFALPSRVEGMPMALIEAISQGCACIAFEVGGAIYEVLTNNVSGYVIKDGDFENFKHKLEMLLENAQLRDRIGKAAIKESVRFSQDEFISKWVSIINKFLR